MKNRITYFCDHFRTQDDGVSGTEYAIMLCIIVLIAFTGYFALGDKISTIFERVSQIG